MQTDIFEKIRRSTGGPIGQYRDKADGYFAFPKLEGELGPHMRFAGKEVLCWSLNNYLGLANHPEIRKVLLPVHVVVPPIGVLDVPDRFLFRRGLAALDRQHGRSLLSAVQGVFLAEGQGDAVDGARLLPEQAGEVHAVVVPGVRVADAVVRQGNLGRMDLSRSVEPYVKSPAP